MFENPLFEISWEVCNKVGGIYTVITSKEKYAKKNFEEYYLIGPYLKNSKFTQKEIPEKYEKAVKILEERGIKIYFGSEEEKDNNVILVDHIGFSQNTNNIKGYLWEKFQIDSLGSSWYDFDEAMLWSWVCGIAIEELTKENDKKIIVHAHEWMSSAAILYLKKTENKHKYKTIFTTHATMLGRAISGSGNNLYEIENSINPDEFAYKIGVQTKHQLEKVVALNCDCFTTVSDITGKEAEKFYEKKPEILLYNGINTENFNFDNIAAKKNIIEFTKGYFNDFYSFDFENSNYIYTSGRNEFRNKGVDLLIESLSTLNENLKNDNSQKNIVCFFMIPIGEFEEDELVINSFVNYKKNFKEGKKDFAPLSTHKLPTDNQIISMLFQKNLLNNEEDKVKIIIIPQYINKENKFISLKYYEFTAGFDLSIFPSYYEPWGYTPMESIAMGTKTFTTDLSGFGNYIKKNDLENEFVEIINRSEKSFEDSADELAQKILKNDFENKNDEIKEFAKTFDWEKFYYNYIKAYKKLLEE